LAVAARDIAPASPFAQLLRQSRFATFDPQIRKTYYSPKSFVERGYWGLKRPITQRKKNSFITIKQWEARQHYTEWDNAEDEVRFIRRMEELDIRPGGTATSRWAMTLGPARSTWLVDSEFAPHKWEPAATEKAPAEGPILLSELGERGPKEYGVHGTDRTMVARATATLRTPTSVIPNVASMTSRQFERYLAKLRAMRPAFAEYLAVEGARRQALDVEDPDSPLAGRKLLEIAQRRHTPYHRLFLAERTEAEYTRTAKIQPQPHRAAALLYSHPSALDTFFRTAPKPGIVLDISQATGRFSDRAAGREPSPYIAAFAGLAAVLPRRRAAGKEPLMNGAVERERWPNAVTELRPTALGLTGVPRVVGPDPEGLRRGVRVELSVTAERGVDNPHRP
ncbi:hypothetical protein B0H17DRAFT_861108, partial [Mycena rosella]